MSNNLYLYQSKLSGSNLASSNFGLRSAISDNGDTILVGSYRDSNSNNIYDGSVYYFNKIDNIFYFNSKITGIREDYAFFGRSVSLNASGDTALIGAYGENIDDSQDVGAAYLFNKVNNDWILRKKITGSINHNNSFGNELALNESGNIGFIAAIDDSRYGQTGAGAVYVYTGIGSNFNYRTIITGNLQSGAYFGTSLSIDKSGNTLVIGAYGENNFSGAAYIFTGNGTNWNLNTKINGNQTSGFFGLSTSIDKNGNYIAIGAPRENGYSGRVFLYKKNGATWDLKKTFSGNYYDQIGRSLNFNYSGNKLFIGGPTASFGQSFNGYALIYTGNNENWNLFQTLSLGNSSQYNSFFANDIKINKNEETLIIGAYAYDNFYENNNAGAVFAFTNSDIKIPKQETSIISSDDVLFTKNYSFSAYKNVYINYPVDSFGYYNNVIGKFSHPTLGLNNLNYLTGYMSSGTGWYDQYVYFYDRENRVSVATIQIYLYDYAPSLSCEDYYYSSNSNLPCDPSRYSVVPVTIQGLSCYRCSGISSSSSSSETKCENFGLFSNRNIVCPNGFESRTVYVNGLVCGSCVNVSSSSSSSSSFVPNPPSAPENPGSTPPNDPPQLTPLPINLSFSISQINTQQPVEGFLYYEVSINADQPVSKDVYMHMNIISETYMTYMNNFLLNSLNNYIGMAENPGSIEIGQYVPFIGLKIPKGKTSASFIVRIYPCLGYNTIPCTTTAFGCISDEIKGFIQGIVTAGSISIAKFVEDKLNFTITKNNACNPSSSSSSPKPPPPPPPADPIILPAPDVGAQCAVCSEYDAGVGANSANCSAWTCYDKYGGDLFAWECKGYTVSGEAPCAYPSYICYDCEKFCTCTELGYPIVYDSQCPCSQQGYYGTVRDVTVPITNMQCSNRPSTTCRECDFSTCPNSSSVSAYINLDLLNILLDLNTENQDVNLDFFNNENLNTEKMQEFIKNLKNNK
jgi:hypothetical protein